MGRRELLTEDERARLFGIPVDEASLARHYTLSSDDLELLLAKRGAPNALGAAMQLGLLRYPGFGLGSNNDAVPEALVRYLASQLNVPANAFRHYAIRVQTRQEHAKELAALLGLRPSARGDLPSLIRHAAEAAAATDKGAVIVGAMLHGIRDARIILPSPDTIERIGLAGRARARKQAAETVIAALTPEQIAGLDALLVNDPTLKRTPLAWLRDVPEAPGATNLNEIIERLTYVRTMQLDSKLALSIHEHRFRQLGVTTRKCPECTTSGTEHERCRPSYGRLWPRSPPSALMWPVASLRPKTDEVALKTLLDRNARLRLLQQTPE